MRRCMCAPCRTTILHAENRDGHFSFRAVFFFFSFVPFTFSAFCFPFAQKYLVRYDLPQNVFDTQFDYYFSYIIYLFYYYPFVRVYLPFVPSDTTHSNEILAGKFIDLIIRNECLLGVNFCLFHYCCFVGLLVVRCAFVDSMRAKNRANRPCV